MLSHTLQYHRNDIYIYIYESFNLDTYDILPENDTNSHDENDEIVLLYPSNNS